MDVEVTLAGRPDPAMHQAIPIGEDDHAAPLDLRRR